MSLVLFILSSLLLSTTAEYAGIWWWTWSYTTTPGITNINIAFSGWSDVDKALSDSNNVFSKLQGETYLSLGGGNANGYWSAGALSKITDKCNARSADLKAYRGVSFDVEEGDAGLTGAFVKAFAACKSAGLKVIVTVSHAVPYGIADNIELMKSIIADSNVDILSPQLYSSGYETTNDYSHLLEWNEYAKFKGSGGIVPSIVSSDLYSSAQNYFSTVGISLNGYIQWSQVGPTSHVSQPPEKPADSGTTRCGTSWTTADDTCGKTCVIDNDCVSPQMCFASLTPCSGSSSSSSSTRCGLSWTDANSQCGPVCQSLDSECPSGLHCFAALSLIPCGGAAVADVSVLREGGRIGEMEVGLIVTGCVAVVAVVVVVVVVLVKRRSKQLETV